MKPKLLVTASTFPRWKGDTEPRFVLDLSVQLRNDFDVTVLVPAVPGAKDKEILSGVKVLRYHYFPIHKWETLCYPGAIVPRVKEKKVRALLVPFLFISLYMHLLRLVPKYDIVHAHWLIPQGIIQSFFRTPYIITGHGGDVTSLNQGLVKKLKIKCLKKAEYITVVSEPLQKKVEELIPGIESEIISMGVDTSQFGKQYWKKNYFGQKDKKVVLFVGRLAEKKGVKYLIEAIKQIDALLVIVGDGPLRGKLEKQALTCKDKIIFLGSKTHEELKTIYASADIFVCPSVTAKDGDQEGLPLVMLEAMASGLPVVASNSGGIGQMIKNGENGLLCGEKNIKQMVDQINCFINNQELYSRIAEKTKETVMQYDYTVIGKKYAKVLKRAVYCSK